MYMGCNLIFSPFSISDNGPNTSSKIWALGCISILDFEAISHS